MADLSTIDPILYMGVDIGVKRDTAALVGVCQDFEADRFLVWGIRIWAPPVNIPQQVVPTLKGLLDTQRVAGVLYDDYQFVSEAQRLQADGYAHLLQPVNQATEMTAAANTLHSLCHQKRLYLPPDPDLRSHFSWANAQQTERGWRIVKRKQAKPIDSVVALAMALMGAAGQAGFAQHPSLAPARHGASILELP